MSDSFVETIHNNHFHSILLASNFITHTHIDENKAFNQIEWDKYDKCYLCDISLPLPPNEHEIIEQWFSLQLTNWIFKTNSVQLVFQMMSIYQLNNSYNVPFTSHHKIYLKLLFVFNIPTKLTNNLYYINIKLSAGTIPIMLHTNKALMCHDRTKRLFTKLIIYPPFLVNKISIFYHCKHYSAGGWEWKGFCN